MTVATVYTKGAITVSPSAPLSEVAQIMCGRNVGTVIVTASPADRPVVVGIITDRDIVRAQLHRTSDLSRLSVADVMTSDPLVLNEQESVESAIDQMLARGVRRAPVIDASGMLVGLVSTADLLAEVSDELFNLVQPIARQAIRTAAAEQPVPIRNECFP